MIRFLIIAVFLFCNFSTIAQVNFGFELSAYSTRLTNISPDTIMRAGHSGAKVTHFPDYGVAPAFVLRKDFGKNFSLETGLGYWSDKYKINLKYYHRLGFDVDDTLNISLKYFQVPVLLNYEIPMKGTLSLLLSGGIRSKILVHHEDNYQEIIFEQIGLGAFNKYKRIVLAPSIAFAGKWELNKGKSLELGFFASRDAMPFVNKENLWGFFHNLYPARNLQTGISLKYFL